ncbi:MAG: transmembrane amino acid transporter protein-domain-containing protein [Monoraphidium minutum]|nr:MAG: transmembrane amino acid transporter protein-domain-containing protein [Monoraphidium minutum]
MDQLHVGAAGRGGGVDRWWAGAAYAATRVRTGGSMAPSEAPRPRGTESIPADARHVAWVIEDTGPVDPYYNNDSLRSAYRSACFTLTLGVLGSSVLPLPFAISKTGILLGCTTMVVVAWTNVATSCMLIRASARTGRLTYEGLAEWAGGRSWRVATQVALLLLLWGTLCGGLALLSDVAVVMAAQAFPPGEAPPWLSGRVLMSALALLVLFPLCLQRHMRQLETAASAGVALVLGLVVLLGVRAVAAGFPGVADGEVPVWRVHVDGHLPEAFSVLAYAFYMQPMMMALLPEMPTGAAGAATMARAVRSTLYGVAFALYASMGVFGAAMFGQDTQGNIMVNRLVEGRAATLVLYGGMLLYLALGMTTTQYALRRSLDLALTGEEDPPFTRQRQVALTALGIGSALAVALVAPGAAEKIISVVGATGVCAVSYIIPVAVALRGYQRGWTHPDDDAAAGAAAAYLAWHATGAAGGGGGGGGGSGGGAAAAADGAAAAGVGAGLGLTAPLLGPPLGAAGDGCGSRGGAAEPGGPDPGGPWGDAPPPGGAKGGGEERGPGGGRGCCARWREAWEGVVEPLAVLAVGVGFSAAALWVAVAALLDGVGRGM